MVVAVRAVAYILSHTGRLASHRKECMAFLCSLYVDDIGRIE